MQEIRKISTKLFSLFVLTGVITGMLFASTPAISNVDAARSSFRPVISTAMIRQTTPSPESPAGTWVLDVVVSGQSLATDADVSLRVNGNPEPATFDFATRRLVINWFDLTDNSFPLSVEIITPQGNDSKVFTNSSQVSSTNWALVSDNKCEGSYLDGGGSTDVDFWTVKECFGVRFDPEFTISINEVNQFNLIGDLEMKLLDEYSDVYGLFPDWLNDMQFRVELFSDSGRRFVDKSKIYDYAFPMFDEILPDDPSLTAEPEPFEILVTAEYQGETFWIGRARVGESLTSTGTNTWSASFTEITAAASIQPSASGDVITTNFDSGSTVHVFKDSRLDSYFLGTSASTSTPAEIRTEESTLNVIGTKNGVTRPYFLWITSDTDRHPELIPTYWIVWFEVETTEGTVWFNWSGEEFDQAFLETPSGLVETELPEFVR